MVEALNKVIKHQFLFPKEIVNQNQLRKILNQSIEIYNHIRPQMSLGGNTPFETFNGISIDLSRFTNGFKAQKQLRKQLNMQNACEICF